MFTFSLLYVFVYLGIFLSLLILAFTQLPVRVITHLSLPHFILFLQKYIPTKNLFMLLIFSLTGLPPVGLFFIKFNILTFLLYQTHIFIGCVLFLMFLLNMLYYIQLFNFKNFNKPLYHILSPEVLKNWRLNLTTYSSYNTYFLTLFIVNTLVFVILSIIIFNDYFLILSLV